MKIATNISQLIRFNSVKSKRKGTVTQLCHSINNEPPLPVLIGLMVHTKTRKKALVNRLASEGLSITYNRVKSIQRTISNQLIRIYETEGMVCPSMLHRNVFTTGAIDNIDHNCTSTTANSSFHGTSISIFQHPSTPTIKLDSFKIDNSNEFHRSRYCLPTRYTGIKPTKGGKPEPPSNKTISETFSSTLHIHQDASAWISELTTISKDPAEHRISFSAFYSKEAITDQCISI